MTENRISGNAPARGAIRPRPAERVVRAGIIALTLAVGTAFGQAPFGPISVPQVPANLQAPEGHSPYLKAFAAGTQNYVCLPGPSGPFWKFLGPQATLFVTTPWINGEARWQVATHYLSSNPAEDGTARATWQSSFDSSVVWGKAIADSTDSQYVAPGSIPWLLVQVVGSQNGVPAGSALSRTTFIQRVNTSRGIAPETGCDAASYGKVALMPYTTDYIFYQANRRR